RVVTDAVDHPVHVIGSEPLDHRTERVDTHNELQRDLTKTSEKLHLLLLFPALFAPLLIPERSGGHAEHHDARHEGGDVLLGRDPAVNEPAADTLQQVTQQPDENANGRGFHTLNSYVIRSPLSRRLSTGCIIASDGGVSCGCG